MISLFNKYYLACHVLLLVLFIFIWNQPNYAKMSPKSVFHLTSALA